MEAFGGIVFCILFVMAGIILTGIMKIQDLRKELDYTQAKANYYEATREKTKHNTISQERDAWFNKPFCEKCWKKTGWFWWNDVHTGTNEKNKICSHY